jgi:neutral ceramidase
MASLSVFNVTRVVGLVTALLFSCTLHADEGPMFSAGAATSNITPPLGESIIGGWQPFPAKHIHDELHARCLVLDDGNTKLVIVICDILGMPRELIDSAKRRITEAINVPDSHILISATHTHSATTARGVQGVMWEDEQTEYQKFLAARIADGVQRAANNLEPAIIAWGSAAEPTEVFNRRWEVTDPAMLMNPFGETDKVRMNPPSGSGALVRPAGPTDPEIGFLSVKSATGQPIALLANYSLHYVGGVPAGEVSADYFGYVCRHMEQQFIRNDDVPFVGMLTNGTSGDINNINFRERGPRRKPYEKMKEVARKVADQIIKAEAMVEYKNTMALNAAAIDLDLKLRKPTAETLAYLEKVSAEQPADNRSKEKIYLERLTKLKDGPTSITARLQVLKIGEQSITAIPFETFVEIGLELKERTPFAQTFTIELANGWYGYLPTPAQHLLGGYETWIGTNFVQKDASEKIVAALLELSTKLKD